MIYRCRFCGQQFSQERPAAETALRAVQFNTTRGDLTVAHQCSTLQAGVADLIGARDAINQEHADA